MCKAIIIASALIFDFHLAQVDQALAQTPYLQGQVREDVVNAGSPVPPPAPCAVNNAAIIQALNYINSLPDSQCKRINGALAQEEANQCLGKCEWNQSACNNAVANYDLNKVICYELRGGVQENVPYYGGAPQNRPYYGGAAQNMPPPPPPPPMSTQQSPAARSTNSSETPQYFAVTLKPNSAGVFPGGARSVKLRVLTPSLARQREVTEEILPGSGLFSGGWIHGRIVEIDGQEVFRVSSMVGPRRGQVGPSDFDIPMSGPFGLSQ